MKNISSFLSDYGAEFIKKHHGLSNAIKPIISPVYRRIMVYLEKRRNRLFRANSAKTLGEFHESMKKNGYNYCLAFGTLLGAIREKGFISHDLDLDVTMWYDDYDDELIKKLKFDGFEFVRQLTVKGGELGREITVSKHGVSIDIFIVYPAIDKYPYFCDFKPFEKGLTLKNSMKAHGRVLARRIQIPISRECTSAEFERLILPIPVNAKAVLAARYGVDYMIPNPNWSEDNLEEGTITIWHDQLAEYFD